MPQHLAHPDGEQQGCNYEAEPQVLRQGLLPSRIPQQRRLQTFPTCHQPQAQNYRRPCLNFFSREAALLLGRWEVQRWEESLLASFPPGHTWKPHSRPTLCNSSVPPLLPHLSQWKTWRRDSPTSVKASGYPQDQVGQHPLGSPLTNAAGATPL